MDHHPHHHHHGHGHGHGHGHDLPPLSSAAVVLPQPAPLGYTPTGLQSYLLLNNPFPHSSSFLFKDDGRRALDAWNTKLARTKRKLARQRTLGLNKSSTSSSSSSSSGVFGCSSSSDEHSKQTTITHYPNTDSRSKTTQNLFTFCTPDNKILRMLLKKELKNSDVGSLGRIVLPKREAEENLPLLTDKEGIQIVIRDVNSNRKWTMKYKYWANNRSRMYVLENTGEFVKQNGLLMGDVMTLYQDECKNLYVSVEKEENESSMEDNYDMRNNYGQTVHSGTALPSYPNMDPKVHQQHDPDQHPSLALFIEQPDLYCNNNNNNNNNNNYVIPQNLDSYYERWSNSYMMNNNNYNNNKGKAVEDLHDFEDCFSGLDTLPEVSGLFKFHQIT